MALKIKKTEHNGPQRGTRDGLGRDVKWGAKKARRRADKLAVGRAS